MQEDFASDDTSLARAGERSWEPIHTFLAAQPVLARQTGAALATTRHAPKAPETVSAHMPVGAAPTASSDSSSRRR
ncbi:hypothetical protein [Streptomyces sp. GZWMJZ-114]|uniref:hypothetical protein n=1 Tax=Streptomyces sp. GZWMJZ-114 TaxID=2494734 RepID=UPI00101033AD|nr:hypothetical protein [Streptomyces sp. GZWMJZ-114]